MTKDEKYRRDEAKAARASGGRYVVHLERGAPGFSTALELADEAYVDGVRVKNRRGAL